MYYRDCTKYYATEVIREILDAAEPWVALELIEQFLDNRMSTADIECRL